MMALASRRLAWLVVGACLASGCRGRAATVEDCRAVLDRLVELELAESGFRDHALTERWTRALRAQLETDMARCQGKRVPFDLRVCLAAARNAEEITHRCLR